MGSPIIVPRKPNLLTSLNPDDSQVPSISPQMAATLQQQVPAAPAPPPQMPLPPGLDGMLGQSDPQPTLAPQPGPVKRMFTNLLQGLGEGLQYSSGVPQAKADVAYKNAETNRITSLQPGAVAEQQANIEQATAAPLGATAAQTLGLDPNLKVTPKQLANLMQAYVHNLGTKDVANINAKGKVDAATVNQGAPVTLTPELAQELSALGDFKPGQQVGVKFLNNALGALGKNKSVTQIAGRAVLLDKATGGKTDLGQSNVITAGANTAQQRAYWQAKYGIAPVTDTETGATYYVPRLDAPGYAPAAHSFDILKSRAGLENYKDALTRIKGDLDVYNDPVQRAQIAHALSVASQAKDPGAISAAIANAVNSGLSEKGADLLAATMQAREFIGANRQYSGNAIGSDAMIGRMIANIAGPEKGNGLNTKLIDQDLANTDRIGSRLTQYQAGNAAVRGGNGAKPAATKDPLGILGSK